MAETVIIREAAPHEAKCLSSLAIRSKAYWGYSDEFMRACSEELEVSSADIESSYYHYVVANIGEEIIGFYALEGLSGIEIELGALFVDPGHIGSGVGKSLMTRAKHHASSLGAHNLFIQGDPHALEFYQAVGGVPTGHKESDSIPGRFLPTFSISLVR